MKCKKLANSTPNASQSPDTVIGHAGVPPLGRLPVTRSPLLPYLLSLVSAILMATASLGGLLWPSTFYPTEALLQSFFANDVVNLFVGLPILLGSLWLTKRGKLVGLLFWPGALLFILYTYIAYIVGVPFSLFTPVYVGLVLLSTYCFLNLLQIINKNSVQAQLSAGVPVRAAGLVLVGFGALFTFRAIGMIAVASINQTALPFSEIGVLIADLVISILFIIGGTLLLRRRPLGYVSGLGLLFVASMLFISLIMVLLLQPVLTNAPFVLVDIIVVSIMGLICFIPFGFFVREAVSKEKSS
jgi:hypothetical protein